MKEARDKERVDRSTFLDHGVGKRFFDARRFRRASVSSRVRVGGFGEKGVGRYRLSGCRNGQREVVMARREPLRGPDRCVAVIAFAL